MVHRKGAGAWILDAKDLKADDVNGDSATVITFLRQGGGDQSGREGYSAAENYTKFWRNECPQTMRIIRVVE